MAWFSRLRCRFGGHPGVYRQWEWKPIHGWSERTDAWTCIRCDVDIETPEEDLPRYSVDRPVLDTKFVDVVNEVIESVGVDRVRLRGGDARTRRRVAARRTDEM